MPNRIVREGILDSARVDQLTAEAEVFFRRLMSIVDDYGRFEADAFVIRGRCYIRRVSTVTTEQIASWLTECVNAGLVILYSAGRKRYLQIEDFKQHIRSKSKYPAPDTCSADEVQVIADDRRCAHLLTTPDTDTDTDTDTNGFLQSQKLNGKDCNFGQPAAREAVAGEDRVKPSPVLDADWFEFREAAVSAGMTGSSVDWDEAWRFGWRPLDAGQKTAASQGIRDRAGSDDPALSSLPANYLKRRMWERRIRGSPQQICPTDIAVEGAKAIARAEAAKKGAQVNAGRK